MSIIEEFRHSSLKNNQMDRKKTIFFKRILLTFSYSHKFLLKFAKHSPLILFPPNFYAIVFKCIL